MRTPEEIQAINDRIAELETKKKSIAVELKKLKKQVAWSKYSERYYTPADHSQDLAVQMFGKRLKDLSPEERKAYNRMVTQKTRARRRK